MFLLKSVFIHFCIILSFVGCSLFEGKQALEFPPNVVKSEFIFSGSKETVENVLIENGFSGEFHPIDPDNQSFRVHYNGESYDSYLQIESALKGKVRYIEPHYILKRVNTDTTLDISSPSYLPHWPEDDYFFYQYGLINIGQSAPFGLPGKPKADMGILKSWVTLNAKGSEDIVVALIDSGIDYTHPELRDSMWVNEKEAKKNGGQDGVNDDADEEINHKHKYTDDVHGFNFLPEANGDERWYGSIGHPDPMDDGWHGTHCAGSIAAADNGVGIIGVAPKVKLMALKAFSGRGGGNTSAISLAILYAVDKGAHVISASFGGSFKSEVILEAIKYAQDKGVLFVAASGNRADNNDVNPSYPSDYIEDLDGAPIENILSVGATDNQDNLANFSNYGSQSVHVMAPGVNIISTTPVARSPKFPYMIASGTSMSTPYVAGIAALVMSYNPDFKRQPKLLRDLLIHTSDKKLSLMGKSLSNGRVNAYRALTMGTDFEVAKPSWETRSENINETGYYEELVDIQYPIEVEGATAIKVHFNRVEIDEPYDSIYLYDKDYRFISNVEVASFDAASYRDYWSPVILGDKVYVRYVNSRLVKVSFGLELFSSESSCENKGGEVLGSVENSEGGTEYQCRSDSSSSDSVNNFTSYQSNGFSIDAIEYTKAPVFEGVE